MTRPRTTPDDRGTPSLSAATTLRYSKWAIGRQIIGKCQCVDCYREYCRGKS